jgi:hypothetical protein
MNEWDYWFAREHHQRLINEAQTERALRQIRPRSPAWRDRLLLLSGDLLITLGNKLKSGSSLYKYTQEGV